MIAKLHGIVEDKKTDSIILLVNGVGYEVYASAIDLDSLSVEDSVKLFIYENIREQAHDLFGFLEDSTKKFFEQLITVNGVGPKMAISIMNIGSSKEIQQAIANGNTKYLQSASGVGKRVAERIIVDLKDKIGYSVDSDSVDAILMSGVSQDEAHEALVSLGYTSYDATKILSKIDPSLTVEEKIKAALRNASK